MGVDNNAVLCFGIVSESIQFPDWMYEKEDGVPSCFDDYYDFGITDLGYQGIDPYHGSEWCILYLPGCFDEVSTRGSYGYEEILFGKEDPDELKERFIKLCDKHNIVVDEDSIGWRLVSYIS